MKKEAWPSFSFTDLLRPPEGWRTEHAILSTYSADLTVIVTSLLALTGCDLDYRRTGSRVELVKAIEALRERVCVLAQHGRIVVPNAAHTILKLLDRFLKTVPADEKRSSWHPKVALVRFHHVDDASDRHWRVWLGSRNLTCASNWETGLVLVSRSDGKGQKIPGLAELGAAFASRAKLKKLSAAEIRAEIDAQTWECPPGVQVHQIGLFGPDTAQQFPKPASDTERAFIISPFLDAPTIRAFAQWGNAKTRRFIVSTAFELQRLLQENAEVFTGCGDLLMQPLPDLPLESPDILAEEANTAAEASEAEDEPPAGLHAKLLYAAKGAQRRLWLGSANATQRGWDRRNFEVVAELSLAREPAEALEHFVGDCGRFTPNSIPAKIDEDEEALEEARKLLCVQWTLSQRIDEAGVEVLASTNPPLTDPAILLEIAFLGGSWKEWPRGVNRLILPGLKLWQRSQFLQVRVTRGERVCAWVQIAPCDPPPDEERDQAVISQYLKPRMFLMWLRNLITDEPADASGDWDSEIPRRQTFPNGERGSGDDGIMPTVEEILRAWARNPSALVSADKTVKAYLDNIERRAAEEGATADVELLKAFRRMWTAVASELQ